MKLLAAFIRLIRSVNLLFIAITQLLFQYCIVGPVFNHAQAAPVLTIPVFVTLIAASVLIAAAGYIINDYFDLNIDLVNKPNKLVVDKIIKRRWTIIWHSLLSFIAVAIGFYIDYTTRIWLLGASNFGCVFLLF